MAVLKFLFSVILCVTLINTVKADVIWPTLYIIQGITSTPSIIIGLIVEILFVKEYMKFDWIKSSCVGIALNAISCLIGYWIIIWGGFPVAVIGSIVAFYLPTPILNKFLDVISFIFCVAVNVLLEGYALKILFKKTFKETYKWLSFANIISVTVAIASLMFFKHSIHF